MREIKRWFWSSAVVVVGMGPFVVGLHPGAGAAGSISTSGATIAAGAAPTQGIVTIDDSAPEGVAPTPTALTPLGALGTMTGALPAFPGAGTGADGAFHATVTQALAGGTFNFTSYLVDSGATVTYTGPVTVLATGNVTINGGVVTSAADAPITIRCAGEFVVDGASAKVATTGSASPVTIDAGRSLSVGTGDGVAAAIGNVTVTAYGTAVGTGDIVVTGGFIEDSAAPGDGQGVVTLRAARSITVTADARVGSIDDPLIVQAFGGDVTVSNGSYLNSRDDDLTVEATGGVRVAGNSYVNTQDGAMFVSAFGADITADSTGGAAYFNTRDGDATLRAAGSILFMNGASAVNCRDGMITVTAFGGDVGLDHADSLINTNGPAAVRASGDVRFEGRLRTQDDLSVEANGGTIEITGDGSVRASVAGAVDLRAATRIEARQGSGGNGSIQTSSGAGNVALSAGSGGIDLDIARVQSGDGGLSMLTSGPIDIFDSSSEGTSAVRAAGSITLISATGGIDVASADITTDSQTGATNSGDILIESFGGAAGPIDADDATITSGGSAATSGSVTLRVHDSDMAPVTRSYFLPAVVTSKFKGEGRDLLVASGFFDDGGETVGYGDPVTIDVGGFSRTFSLTPNKKGTSFTFKGPDLVLRVKPNRNVENGLVGSSRGKFRMKVSKTTLSGLVPVDGEVDFHFSATGLPDAQGIVVLESGKYKLGRKRGTLTAPAFLPKTVKAKVSDTKPDKVRLIGGFATTGPAPSELGTVLVGVGETFSLEIPGDSFEQKGDVWTFRERTDGRQIVVVIDFLREQVKVSTKGVEAGDLMAPTVDVLFDSGAGAEAVGTTIVLSQPSATLRVY